MRTLTGLELRYVLVTRLLDAATVLYVEDLARAVESAGFHLAGRPGKVISDALRWEVRRGRVVRVGRGCYQAGRMPRSTEWYIRRRVAYLLEHGPGASYMDAWIKRSAGRGRLEVVPGANVGATSGAGVGTARPVER